MRNLHALFALSILVSSVGVAHAEGSSAAAKTASAPRAPRAPVPLEEYFKIRRVGSRSGILLSFSHDERLVAYLSDEGGRSDVWAQPVAGGPATQITHVKGFIQGLAFSPAANRLAYTTDVGGDELPHLFLTDSKGTAPRDLIPDQPAGRRTDFVEWAEDGKTFLYLSSLRDERYMDLYEYDVATGKSARLWESAGKLAFAGTSRDHRRFLITEQLSDADSNLYLFDRGQKGPPRLLTEHKGQALFSPADVSRDGKTLYYTSDEKGEFSALLAMDLATRQSRPVVHADWDVEEAGFTRGWKYFYSTTNADGQIALDIKDVKTDKSLALPPPPPGGAWVPLTSSRSDRYLGVRLQGDGAPAAPYVIDLQTHAARKLIEPLPPTLRDRKMIVGEVVHIPSFDGRKVPAFLYRPEGPGPFPAVIDVHGGPTRSADGIIGIRQYLLARATSSSFPTCAGRPGTAKRGRGSTTTTLGGGPLETSWRARSSSSSRRRRSRRSSGDGRQLRRLHGPGGGDVCTRRVRGERGLLRRERSRSLVESFPAYWAASAAEYLEVRQPKEPGRRGLPTRSVAHQLLARASAPSSWFRATRTRA